ncbi:hypothetical protein [Actibacterium pelagium]|nr:hypothetical protein [Actibacterium pelagium]
MGLATGSLGWAAFEMTERSDVLHVHLVVQDGQPLPFSGRATIEWYFDYPFNSNVDIYKQTLLLDDATLGGTATFKLLRDKNLVACNATFEFEEFNAKDIDCAASSGRVDVVLKPKVGGQQD